MPLTYAVLAVLSVLVAGIIPAGSTEWYQRFPNFDTFLHVAGGFTIAWLLVAWFIRDLKQLHGPAVLIFLLGGTMLVGVGWEIAEYLSGHLFSDAPSGWQAFVWRYFHGGGLTDTLGDLIADAGGALGAAVLFLRLRRRNH
jgi:hypothetical protein